MSDPTSRPPLPGRPPAWQPENEPTLQYGVPTQQPQYYQQPQYQMQQPQYQMQQPYYEQPPLDQPPRGNSRTPWLVAGAIALAVALVGGAGVLMLTRSGGNEAAGPPVPTGSYTDGLSNSEPSADPSTQPSTEPSDQPTPSSTPKPSPTPVEKRRTLKDVDQGIKVYDDVYVNPAKGWRKFAAAKYMVRLTTDARGTGYVVVLPAGYPAASAVKDTVTEVSKLDRLTGLRLGPVKSVRPANSNIANQAQVAFSARFKHQGVTYSLVGRCTTMTGVESIHNVTVTLCVEARKETADAAFRDYTRMVASVARSI